MAKRSCLRGVTWFLVLGAAACIVVPATAATVNGTLTVTPELGRRSEQYAAKRFGPLKRHFWRVPNGAVATKEPAVNLVEDLAVLLQPVGSATAAPAGRTAVVKLRGASLHPRVTIVTPHTKVRFRNNDVFIYELTCEANPQMERAPQLPPGNQVDYTFDEPGVFEIVDRRLPHVAGWVVVTPTGKAARPSLPEPRKNGKRGRGGRPSGDAAFVFEDVAAGQYQVKVFHGGEWIAEQPLEIPEDDDEVGVQIRLPADGQQHQQEGAAGGNDSESESESEGE
jgi:plastocyanin